MIQRFLLATLTIFCTNIWAQDEDERVYVTSCSLFVKATVYTPDSSDVAGKAMIEAALSDKNGIPIPGRKITLTATCGTLTCLQSNMANDSAPRTQEGPCFTTGNDGKILVFLVDIPFNKPGRVKAGCTFGDFKVNASSKFSIMRKITKNGNRPNTSSEK
jgi:hypothetical protein